MTNDQRKRHRRERGQSFDGLGHDRRHHYATGTVVGCDEGLAERYRPTRTPTSCRQDLATTHGGNPLPGNHLSVLAQRVEGPRGCVQSEHDTDATAKYRARVCGDLPGYLVELAVGGLAAFAEPRPHLVPPLSYFRDPLSVSGGPRNALSGSSSSFQRLVGPGDLAARSGVGDTFG